MYTYLKFGLPRVFPPNPRGEGSSGYDSSDDGGRGRGSVPPRGSLGRTDRYTRSKSNPDLLNARDWASPVVDERETRRPKVCGDYTPKLGKLKIPFCDSDVYWFKKIQSGMTYCQ